jgi:CheY-specific phosphatase CheX
MASEPIDKKLDRYYDDIMNKLSEILEAQRNMMVEHKELKKDVAKVKEYVLEIRDTTERIDIRTEGQKNGGSGFKTSGGASTTSPSSSSTSMNNSPSNATAPTAGSAPATRVAPSAGPTPNLKDFLSQQLAIFDVKVLNAFIKSTKEIVKSNSRIEPAFIKPVIESKITLPIVIAGKMNLARDKGNGAMALCFDQLSASAVTRAVFMLSEDSKVTDSDIKDVTSEICNQICGKSKLALKNEGYSFEIDMPEIHQGTTMELYALLGYPKIVLQFEFQKIPFYIYFWG